MKEPKITIGQDIVQIVAEIDDFKGRWQASKKLPPERLQQLRKAATLESIGASTRIAGAKLSNARIEAVLSVELMSDANPSVYDSGDEAAVTGYAEAMELVLQKYHELDLSDGSIHQLHRILLRNDSEHDSAENESRRGELKDLLRWTSTACNQASVHPLLITAIFKVLFLAIRPFQDGNGRLARILTTLMLLRAGYSYVPYTSLEGVIEKDKEYYHKALKRTQTTLDDDSPDWQPWLAFFLRSLKQQQARLAPTVEHITATDSKDLPQLSMDVLVLLSQHDSLSLSQLAEMTGAEQSKLKPTLRELSHAGHIQRHGEAESGQYKLPP